MAVFGNGGEILDAFVNRSGSWVRPKGIHGRTPTVWVKGWPYNPDPMSSVDVTPDHQDWVLTGGEYRAVMNVAVVGGSGDFSYNWQVTAGTATIMAGQGTASVTVRTANKDQQVSVRCTVTDNVLGGSMSDTATVGTEIPALYVLVSPQNRNWSGSPGSFSTTFSATPTGGTGSYSYSWTATGDAVITSGQGTSSVTVSSTGGQASTVTCTVTSGAQTAWDSGAVAAASIPALTLSVTPSSQGWSGPAGSYVATFNATPGGGSGSYGFSWSVTGGTISSGQGTANVTVVSNTGAAATVTCTITDTVLGGTKSAGGSVTAKALSASLSPTSVSGASTSVGVQTNTTSVSVSGGSGSYSFEWRLRNGNGPNIIASRQGTAVGQFEAAPAPGSTVTALWYCRVTDNVTGTFVDTNDVSVSITRNYTSMSVSVSPASLSGSSTSEPVDTTGSATVNVSGGSGDFSFQWIYNNTGTGGLNPINGASATTKFRTSPGISAGQTYTAGWYCRVTDNVTGEVKNTGEVMVTLTCEYPALSVSASPASLSGIGNASGVSTSGSASVNTSGGSGNFSFQWEAVSGSGVNPNSGTSSSTAFSATLSPGQSVSGSWRCKVTDNVTGVVRYTGAVSISLQRYATLSATATPGSLSGSSTSEPVETSGSATANVSGGSGSYSFFWEWDQGAASGSIVPTTGTSQSTAFRSGDAHAPGTTRGAGFRCRVRDTVTNDVVVTNSVGINLTRTAPEITGATIFPSPATWDRYSFNDYRTIVSAEFSGGLGPFTYTWYSPDGGQISFTTVADGGQVVEAKNNAGSFFNIACDIRDSLGRTATAYGSILDYGGV